MIMILRIGRKLLVCVGSLAAGIYLAYSLSKPLPPFPLSKIANLVVYDKR